MGQNCVLSWYINPHLFWLRSIDFARKDDLMELEYSLTEYYNTTPSKPKPHEPFIGETVAYNCKHYSKWYRAVVDFQLNKSSYILWLVDYGYAVISHYSDIRELKTKFDDPENFGNILKVGISKIMPAKEEYDFINAETKQNIVEKWDNSVVENIKMLLKNAATIKFVKKHRITDHLFGNVLLQTKDGVEVDLANSLSNSPFARKMKGTHEFSKEVQRIQTASINRYQNLIDEKKKTAEKPTKMTENYVTKTDHNKKVEKVTVPVEVSGTSTTTSSSLSPPSEKPVKSITVPQTKESLMSKKDCKMTEKHVSKTNHIKKVKALVPIGTSTSSSDLKFSPQKKKTQKWKKPEVVLPKIEPLKFKEEAKKKEMTPEMPKSIHNTTKEETVHQEMSPETSNPFPRGKSMIKIFDSDDDSDSNPIVPAPKLINNWTKQPELESQITSNIPMGNFSTQNKIFKLSNQQTKKTEPRKLCIMPADYDQVKSQYQRTKPKHVPETKKFYKHGENSNKMVENRPKDSGPIFKNSVMEKLDAALAEKGVTVDTQTTSDDGSIMMNEQVLLNENKFPIGPINKLEEIESQFLDVGIVLAHGKQPSQTVKSYMNANFHPKVLKTLKTYHRSEIHRIQTYGWPHILHENSTILIGGPSSGKTQTIIPAICSVVIRLYEDQQNPPTVGPVAIIVASSAKSVSDIITNIRFSLKNWKNGKTSEDPEADHLTILQSIGVSDRDIILSSLLEGMGIFVVTPPSLARWVNEWKVEGIPLFNKDRLKIFAVDDFDMIYTNYGETICELIETFCDKETQDKTVPQMVITSSTWMPQFYKYCRFGKNPALYITNYIEACAYGKTKFRLSFIESSAKATIVDQFLYDDIYKTKRSMIICSTDEEVTNICKYLKEKDIKYSSLTQDSDETDRNIALTWHQTLTTDDLTVLVCSDAVLDDLSNIRNVQMLLNYSLPAHYSTLSRRFAVFFETFHDFVQNKKRTSEAPSAQIIVDETGCRALPRLIEFMNRINAKIPPEVNKMARDFLIVREKEEVSHRLCPFFLQFGKTSSECMENKKCGGRHALSPADFPTKRMPKVNTVLKLKITVVHNPIHFSGQILEYYRDNKWHHWQNQNQPIANADLNIQLQSFYNNEENKIKQYPLNKGDLCALNDQPYYHRIQILQITGTSPKLSLTVRLIDTGEIYIKKYKGTENINWYVLPDKFKEIPPRAIDIHTMGIVPFDQDLSWCSAAKTNIEKKIEDFNKKSNSTDYYITANVRFCIENNIWTNNITLCDTLMGNSVHTVFLYRDLLDKKLAERTDEFPQIEVMQEMAKVLEFDKKHYESDEEEEEEKEELKEVQEIIPQIPAVVKEPEPIAYRSRWDTLSQSALHRICINFLNDPKEFAFTRIDRVEKEDKLYKMIDEFEVSQEFKILQNPKVGDNCLIPLDNGKARGRIISFGSDDQGDFIKVFSCDNGDLREYDYDEVFVTSKEIVEFMPYTSIFGSFAGIEPINGESYDTFATTEIWNTLDNAQQNGNLYAHVVKAKEDLDWLPAINRYDLILSVKNTEGFQLLNHEFVTKGIAKWDLVAGPIIQKITPEHLFEEFNETDDSDEQENWEANIGTYTHQPAPEDTDFKDVLDDLSENEKYDCLQMLGFTDAQIEIVKKSEIFSKQKSSSVQQENEDNPFLRAIEAPKEPISVIEGNQKLNEDKTKETKNMDILVHKVSPSIITWEQHQAVIVLSIKVGDNPDYHLEVHDSYMIFAQFLSIDEEPQLTIINFFGQINVKRVSHQIRGLNLIIRLVKMNHSLTWPTLQNEQEKVSYIKYNLDAMTPLDDDFEFIFRNSEDEKDSQTSDNELYDADSDAIFESDDSDSESRSFSDM